jgi:hypothetical protein
LMQERSGHWPVSKIAPAGPAGGRGPEWAVIVGLPDHNEAQEAGVRPFSHLEVFTASDKWSGYSFPVLNNHMFQTIPLRGSEEHLPASGQGHTILKT